MGLVIPWMVRALSFTSAGTAVRLYAANTIGGVVGIVCVLLWALPAWGLTGAGLAVCGVNLAIAGAALWLGSVSPRRERSQSQISQANLSSGNSLPASFRIQHAPSVLAFCSGFLVLALEVV